MQKNRNSAGIAILWNILWSVSAACINYFMQFLITPYITNNIGIEAYGFVTLSTTMTTYLDIAAIGLNAFALRYISVAYHEGDKKRANVFFSSVIAGNAIFACVILLTGTLAIAKLELFLQIPGELTADVKLLFAFVLINYSLTLFRTVYNSAIYIENRIDVAERKKSVSYFIQAGLLVALCIFCTPHVWYVGLAYIPATAYFLVQCYRISGKMTPELHFVREDCSGQAIKALLSSGVWNSLNSLGNVLNSGLDLLITNIMISATVLGQLSVAQNIATVSYFMVNKISESFRPRQLYLYAKKDTERQISLFRDSMKITGLFCGIMICGFIACGEDFLSLWIKEQNSSLIFTLSITVLFSYAVSSVVNPLYYVFTLTERVKIPCLITIGMGFANVISMYLLLKLTEMGVFAVVITTLVLNNIHLLDTPLYAAYCLKVKWTTFYPVILRYLVTLGTGCVAAGILRQYLWTSLSWMQLLGKILLTGFVLGIIMVPAMLGKSGMKKLSAKIKKKAGKSNAAD